MLLPLSPIPRVSFWQILPQAAWLCVYLSTLGQEHILPNVRVFLVIPMVVFLRHFQTLQAVQDFLAKKPRVLRNGAPRGTPLSAWPFNLRKGHRLVRGRCLSISFLGFPPKFLCFNFYGQFLGSSSLLSLAQCKTTFRDPETLIRFQALQFPVLSHYQKVPFGFCDT